MNRFMSTPWMIEGRHVRRGAMVAAMTPQVTALDQVPLERARNRLSVRNARSCVKRAEKWAHFLNARKYETTIRGPPRVPLDLHRPVSPLAFWQDDPSERSRQAGVLHPGSR